MPEAGHNVTRGFPVINRPWSMLLFIDMKEFRERIIERYVYIAETDHLLRHDIPNRAPGAEMEPRCSRGGAEVEPRWRRCAEIKAQV